MASWDLLDLSLSLSSPPSLSPSLLLSRRRAFPETDRGVPAGFKINNEFKKSTLATPERRVSHTGALPHQWALGNTGKQNQRLLQGGGLGQEEGQEDIGLGLWGRFPERVTTGRQMYTCANSPDFKLLPWARV